MTLAITGGSTLTMDPDQPFIKKSTILIEDSKIVDIGSENEINIPSGAEILKLSDHQVVLPGLINAHTHASMTLLRGYADDMKLHEWLTTKIFPLEAKLNPSDIYLGTKLACIESLLGGATTLNSMYFSMDAEARAIDEMGLRAYIGHAAFEWTKATDIAEIRKLASSWHGKADGRIRVSVDPHAPYTVSPEYLMQLKDEAESLNQTFGNKGNIPIHFHLAETKMEEEQTLNFLKEQGYDLTEFQLEKQSGIFPYLDQLGFFGETENECPQLIAAHAVHLKSTDYPILTRYPGKISIAHCPVSNLKLGSGIAPLPDILQRNIPVGLGTDGTATNNTLNMFETMKFTALIHKGFHQRADIITASETLQLATNGEAIHWKHLGKLKPDYLADLIIVNLKKPHLMPIHDITSHLVYSAHNDVEYAMCNGEMLLEEGKPVKINLEDLFEQVQECKTELLTRN